MARITDLSNEILLDIISYLTTSDDSNVRTLSHLCRTSRSLCGVAQPALYSCVRIVESATDPLLHLKLFLWTLIECPSLAQKTKEFALYNDRGLPRLPNLQHIHFTAQIEAPRALMHRIYEMQVDLLIFSKLKTFHLHKQYEDGPLNIEDYMPLMQFPLFEKFSSESDVPNTPDGSCAVNTLTHMTAELFWCLGPLSTMKALLQTCPRLTVFKLIIPDGTRYRWLWDVGYQPLVTPRDLVKALLQTHRQRLQTLHLDFHDHYNLRDPEILEDIERLEDFVYTYPSFRDFESLTHMAIELEKLVRLQDLPMSLEHLDLSYCHFPDLNQASLIDLVQLKGKWCPAIKSVVVRGWETTSEGINAVREHATSLDISVHVAEDGRVLTILSGGYRLTIKSLLSC
ncbi:hypothetical protein COCCADRAFT_103024 [Bipolaris zeicola 26-R-13]|uniref:Uncharacterized protein n=1 Tax=Cochliobolus carbonum (strain 26-R-13) TaxID=930089 RepID=W6XYG3_COCC2|nr:uncharacterized protein COCCADRAFT_103024 [Bipolaris zeicola 26-R-13]EUC30758.1 hypothetical protein COCCADRAFT_103024 [Bipolaris zeicola 26-R-13]